MSKLDQCNDQPQFLVPFIYSKDKQFELILCNCDMLLKEKEKKEEKEEEKKDSQKHHRILKKKKKSP